MRPNLPFIPPTLQKAASYLIAIAGVALTTGVIRLIPGADHVNNISLLYLLVVIASAYGLGSGPAVLAAGLGVLSFSWFFVAPRYTLAVDNPADWLTLGIFLVTAVVINQLTQTLRLHAEDAQRHERETAALSRASWAVASQISHQRTLTAVLQQITGIVPGEVAAILVPGEGGVEIVASQGKAIDFNSEPEKGVIESVFAGATIPGAFPLSVEQRVLGVLVFRKADNEPLLLAEKRILESLANHATVALERHRLMEAQAQAQALGEADKLKTALLSMVSHDFRSPLAAIKTSVTGLLQDDLPWDAATQRELLTGINQETDRLNRMVGDILALSRLEADAWRPQCEWVPIAEIVGAALDGFSARENARITVQLEDSSREVSLDSVQIVQVLANLIENALKYSPPESVVELKIEACGAVLAIEVMDRGYGLPSGEEERIFERFYRASRWRESALPGSGIGLAICRGLAEAHGGQLLASNREGGGAVFSLLLPLQRLS